MIPAGFAFAAPLALALIALVFGNKETSFEILDHVYTLRPLRLAVYFVIIDVLLFVLMCAAGMITL